MIENEKVLDILDDVYSKSLHWAKGNIDDRRFHTSLENIQELQNNYMYLLKILRLIIDEIKCEIKKETYTDWKFKDWYD